MAPDPISARMWAVAGGKGGVGKSVLSVNLACGLAQRDYRVILVDADLAGANVHTLFGLRQPERTLNDFMTGRAARIADILIQTPLENLKIICGAADFVELANPGSAQKERLMSGILELDADYIVIDIGAGSTLNNLDFFAMADGGVVVTSPAPTAMQNAYSFLKMAVYRKLRGLFPEGSPVHDLLVRHDQENPGTSVAALIEAVKRIDDRAAWLIVRTLLQSRCRLVVSMATEVEGEKVSAALAGVAYQYLRIKLPHLGTIPFSVDVERSVRKMNPLMLADATASSESIWRIVRRIITETDRMSSDVPLPQAAAGAPAVEGKRVPAGTLLCLNDEIAFEGTKLHVQTEDLGPVKARILTLVFGGGRILFSRQCPYADYKDQLSSGAEVPDIVRRQHKLVLAGISAGKLREKIREGGRQR